MTDAQIAVGSALVGSALLYYYIFLRPMLSKDDLKVDEIDLELSNFKRRRTEMGLCIYCGSPSGSNQKTDGVHHAVCSKCRNEMSPDVM